MSSGNGFIDALCGRATENLTVPAYVSTRIIEEPAHQHPWLAARPSKPVLADSGQAASEIVTEESGQSSTALSSANVVSIIPSFFIV